MDESAYGGSWYADTMVTAPQRPPLVKNIDDADVCVVGGGLAGLTVAYELARHERRVVLLEAGRIACQASGRNGGFVIPGFALDHGCLVRCYGSVAAHHLWGLSVRGVDYVRSTITRTAMQGVNMVPGLLLVRRTDNRAAAREEANAYIDLGTPAQVWDTPAVQGVLSSAAYFQAVHLPTAFHIHPLNYALGLANEVERMGGRIFEDSRAISFNPSGGRKRIDTGKASVLADTVVLTQGADPRPLIPAWRVMPITSHIAVTDHLGPHLNAAINFAGGIFDTRNAPTYYRVVDGDRLLWGGPVTCRVPPRERLTRIMQDAISTDYPQLANADLTHVWTGIMAYVHHLMPVIDQIVPGLWFVNAFGGHGLNTTAMAGELVADAITTGSTAWHPFRKRGFAPPGSIGRKLAFAMYGLLQLSDWLAEFFARRQRPSG